MDEPMKPLLSADEVARILNVSRITVYRLVKRGELTVKKIGSKLRFDCEEIQKFLTHV